MKGREEGKGEKRMGKRWKRGEKGGGERRREREEGRERHRRRARLRHTGQLGRVPAGSPWSPTLHPSICWSIGAQLLFKACEARCQAGDLLMALRGGPSSGRRIVRSPDAVRPLTSCNCGCKVLTAAQKLMGNTATHQDESFIWLKGSCCGRQMTDDIFQMESVAHMRVSGPSRLILSTYQ